MTAAPLLPPLSSSVDFHSPAPLPVRIEVWDDSQRQQAFLIWQWLETDLNHQRLTSRTEWVETWVKYFAPLIPYRFLIGFRGREPIGIALASIETGALGIRTWHLGTAGEPDRHSVCVEFNSFLVQPNDHGDFCREVQRILLERTDCDALAWDGFDPQCVPAELLSDRSCQVRWKPTFYYDLRRAREEKLDPIMLLGDSTRKNLRQNLRGAGDVRVEWSETPSELDEYYDQLIAFHQARWQAAGEPGAYSSSVFRLFHREALHRLLPAHKSAVVRASIGGRPIGCTQIYVDRDRALIYQTGWSGDSPLRSPGLVNDFCCLSECLRRGLDAYDFMAGDTNHKRRMTTDQGRLIWAEHRKSKWKFDTVDRLRAAKRFCRSFWTGSFAGSPSKVPS